jgi:hypothetical protein
MGDEEWGPPASAEEVLKRVEKFLRDKIASLQDTARRKRQERDFAATKMVNDQIHNLGIVLWFLATEMKALKASAPSVVVDVEGARRLVAALEDETPPSAALRELFEEKKLTP